MSRFTLILFAMIFLGGCGGRNFTNLGNGVGVPPAAIEDYAAANGITGEEARTRLRKETEQRRIAEFAKRHGVSLAEAQQQLERAR